MRIDPLWDSATVARPERPENELALVTQWKSLQPINAAMLTDPVAALHMIAVSAPGKSANDCLSRSEIALLTLRNLEKSPVIWLTGRCTHVQEI